jgi:hypothetical protein
MPSLFFNKEIISFASQFPQLATTIFTYSSQLSSSLSPKAQANALKLIKNIYNFTILMIKKTIDFYQSITRNGKDVADWGKPSSWVLYPIASFILFIFPINHTISDAKDSFKDKTIMFVNNRHLYGLEVIPLVAGIYCQTGIWVRVETESFRNICFVISRFLYPFMGADDSVFWCL